MRKNSFFTCLNITGFATGFAVSLVLALFISKETTVDRCFKNYKNIYRVIDAKKNSSRVDYDLAQMIKAQYPEVKLAAPVNYSSPTGILSISKPKNQNFVQVKEIICTSNDFFRVFSIKTIISKTSNPFADQFSLVITHSIAKKLFGRTDVIGEPVNIGNMVELQVSAVVEDFPENTSLGADIFLNSENPQFRFSQYCSNSQCYNPLDLYVAIHPGKDAHELERKMNLKFPVNKSGTESIKLQPISEIYLSRNINDNNNRGGSKGLIEIFLAIAILILILSVINYVNFSLSKQLSTLKEIGIKLTNGAGINHLRIYYITEVSLSIFISFLIALAIAKFSLPYAEHLFGTTLQFPLLFSPSLLVVFVVLLLLIILITSFAPVYIVSKFDVQRLFGKKNQPLSKQSGKRILTVFQLVASIVLIICVITIQKQLRYVKTTDLGFNKELLLKLEFPENLKSAAVIKHEIDNCSFVKSTVSSTGAPGFIRLGMGSNEKDIENFNLDCIMTDENFLKTFGIKLVNGREFLRSDFGNSCYINKAALKRYGWKNIDDKKFNNGRDGGYKIIGLVDDFHVASLHNRINPVCIIYDNWHKSYTVLTIRLKPGNLHDQIASIRNIWQKNSPEVPFNFNFYDDYFNSLYQKEERQANTITLFSIIALVITCLGLLGQIFQICIFRIKEIGIRKVNGARVTEILAMLNKDFIKWVVIAFFIACPISWYAMHQWLQNFAYKTELSWWVFGAAGFVAVAVAVLTVSWQSWRAATRNPVEALRYE